LLGYAGTDRNLPDVGKALLALGDHSVKTALAAAHWRQARELAPDHVRKCAALIGSHDRGRKGDRVSLGWGQPQGHFIHFPKGRCCHFDNIDFLVTLQGAERGQRQQLLQLLPDLVAGVGQVVSEGLKERVQVRGGSGWPEAQVVEPSSRRATMLANDSSDGRSTRRAFRAVPFAPIGAFADAAHYAIDLDGVDVGVAFGVLFHAIPRALMNSAACASDHSNCSSVIKPQNNK